MAQPPCNWQISMDDCPDWGSYEDQVKASALEFASLTLWAATGRRFGLCDVTVRPYGIGSMGCPGAIGWIADDLSRWVPYELSNGVFRSNASWPAPRCEVWLPGRVDSVTEVWQDGVLVDPSAYRVDDWSWLVRTDGGCWPTSVDMGDDTNVFQVRYMQGTPVPGPLLDAAATLACEWAKGRVGDKTCRLPTRVTSISRQGVSMTALDTDSLTKRNFTGITEVDQVIFALNPKGLEAASRVYSPDIRYPRQVTG